MVSVITVNSLAELQKAGSFWRKYLSVNSQKIAESLVATALNNTLLDKLQNAINRLALDQSKAEYYSYQFTLKYSDMFLTYSDIGSEPEHTQVPETNKTLKLVGEIKETIVDFPKGLLVGNNLFIAGVDFVLTNNKLWVINQRFIKLFVESETVTVTAVKAKKQATSMYNTIFGVDYLAKDKTEFLVNFFRKKQSIVDFTKALHAITDQPMFSKGGIITGRYDLPDSIKYTTSEGEIVVTDLDSHALLQPGQEVPTKTFFTNAIEVVCKSTHGVKWWENIDWSYGLDLGQISRYNGLLVPKTSWAYIGDFTGTDVHARFQLFGAWETQKQFFEEIQQKEIKSGFQYLLNSVIGLQLDSDTISGIESVENLENLVSEGEDPLVYQLTNKKLINAIDIFFEYGLNNCGVVITLDERKIQNIDEVVYFIKKNIPVSWIPIIRIRVDDTTEICYPQRQNLNTLEVLVDEHQNIVVA